MEFTGERFIPKKAFGEIEIEHMQRYYSVLNIIKDKVVLDAACGVGYGTGMMSEHAKFVYGIDIDEEAIAEAQKLYGRENTAFIHSSIEKINLKDHSVDVVVSFETIEHVNHDVQKQFMREIKRILKPDGILIMSTPDKLYYSDLINHRNPFHIKEFYYDEFQLFLNNFFENVHMFKQGFEQLSVLSHSDEQIKERSKYKLIDPNQHTNSQSKYIVAVCSDIEIPNVDSIGSVMLLNEKPNLSSRLLADFGEGYREDVVVYSEIEIHGNEFRVEFRDLEQLYGVQRYKWLLIQDKMVNVKISSSFPEVKIEAINGWQSINGIDEFHNRQPIYEITGSISNIDKLVITGYIHILNESEIVRTFSNRITNLENQVQVKQEYSNIENQLSLISNYVQNQERLYREIDELKQLTELQHKNEEKLIEKQEILQLKNNNLLQHIDQIKSDYHHQLAQMKHMLNEVTDQRNHISYLHSQMQELNHSLLHSKSWKITSPLRSIANRKRIWTSNSRKAIKKIIKKTYRSLPLNEQRKIALKDFVYQNFKWALKNTGMYHSWLQSKNQNNLFIPQHGALKSISFDNLDRNFGQPGKIAVHLHLYYTDLLDEFYQYFSNIPYTFDLFVSIVHSDKLEHVQNKFSGISNIENLVVKVTPNRGRDVAPMFAEFGSELSKYDYFCHVHSKKSLYTGTQQDGWRRHLLDNLFGSPAILENVFALFHTYPNLGCIYPDTFNTIPYWAHTWLSNKGIGSSFLSRMGIKHDFSKYVDYPAGTMFWAKVSSLKPIFDLNLTYNDFAEEAKQIDGTIAHVIERALLQIVKSTGYDYCEVNFYHNYCSFNKGTKNLRQYWDRNINLLKNIIADVEIVTFDIFDTLITRPLLSPDTVFEIIETKVKHLLNPDLNYISMRKNAESEVRMKNNYRGDCSIHEIYEEMITLYNISADLSMQLKQMEIDLEIKLAMPREDVVDCLNYAKALNKKVILISDMYLDKKIVTQMLNKCNIHNYDELWISSETGMRKDTGEIWSKFVELYGKSKTVHVGDNEHSDVQLPGDRDLITFHVMNGSTMFYNTNFGHLLYDSIYANENWGDSILLGPIVAKQLNSPFKIKNGQVQLTELKEVGYTIFGPILLQYIIWLTKKLQENHETKVLFLAREGYLLKNYSINFILQSISSTLYRRWIVYTF